MEILEKIIYGVTLLGSMSVVFGFYFNTKTKMKEFEKKFEILEEEMEKMELEQKAEIGFIKEDIGSIKISLATITANQKSQKDTLEDIKQILIRG